MIFLITGASHTGKTLLAQKLLEKYKFSYLSIDHLKMGLIRSGQTTLTAFDDKKLTDYLWPIIREIIKTTIENKQNLIIEGCYIPFDWQKDFPIDYLTFIKYICLVFSKSYIQNNHGSIMKYANAIENRICDKYTKEEMIADNNYFLEQCKKYNLTPIVIETSYSIEIDFNILESKLLLPKLFKVLKKYYDYSPKNISEVLGGTVGYTYSVDNKYFFKVYDKTFSITESLTCNLEKQLKVIDILQNRSSLKNKICYPIKTKYDTFYFEDSNIKGVLFNLINAKSIGWGNEFTSNDIRQISSIVDSLHSLNVKIFEDICPKEDFAIEFCNNIKEILNNGLSLLPQHFSEILAINKKHILAKIEILTELSNSLKANSPTFVLCHTDIHGGNVMRDETGKVYLIDWESILLAPKEADLYAFCEKEYLKLFSESINETALAFYLVKRDLVDIFEFISALLNDEYSTSEQAEVYGHLTRILEHLKKI